MKQIAVRTQTKSKDYKTDLGCYLKLNDYLKDGWSVLMCNPIGSELEYILQKED